MSKLRFKNMGELRNKAGIEANIFQRMKSNPNFSKTFKNARELHKEGLQKQRHRDMESAYMLLYRCCEVCTVITKFPGFVQFKCGPDGRVFYDFYRMALDDLNEITKNLTDEYQRQDAENQPIPDSRILVPEVAQKPEDPVDEEKFGIYIKPKELVDSVEKHKKVAMILDYRANNIPSIAYHNSDRRSDNIRVLSIPIQLIAQGLDFRHLQMYTPEVRSRNLIKEIVSYDLVVLMGDELRTNESTTLTTDTKTAALIEALTTNNLSYRLRRPPLLLRGGFPAWQNAYPMHVFDPDEENSAERLGENADEFSLLLQSIKRSTLNFKYPELSSSLTLSTPIGRDIPPQSDILPRSTTPPTAGPFTSSVEPKSVIAQGPSKDETTAKPTIESEKTTPGGQDDAVVASKPRPLVDRSNKPTDQPSTTTEFPVHPDRKPISAPSAPTRSFGTVGKHKPQPLIPPTLGGARVDFPPPAASAVPQTQPARPPIPPRIPKISPQLAAEYSAQIHQVYAFTFKDICDKSKRGNVNPGHTGLYNMGNTCFMNCALQALTHTPQMREIFSQNKYRQYLNPLCNRGTRGAIVASFGALMDVAWTGNYEWILPKSFLKTFADLVNHEMGDNRQHDAREFLMSLLDAMHEDMNRVGDNERFTFEQDFDGSDIVKQAAKYENDYTKGFASSPIMDIFYLRTVSKISCRRCGKMSVTFEETPQVILELPVDGHTADLKQCLNRHYGDMLLDGLWKCENCGTQQNATRSTKIWKLPEVMVICLKRFAQKYGELVKNNIEVGIHDLNMKFYLDPKSPEHFKSTDYELYAVTYHFGQLNGGHYTSKVRERSQGSQWLNFDDQTVTLTGFPQSSNAFILYYSRV